MKRLHSGQLIMLWLVGGLLSWYLFAFAQNVAPMQPPGWWFWPLFFAPMLITVGSTS